MQNKEFAQQTNLSSKRSGIMGVWLAAIAQVAAKLIVCIANNKP